MSPKEYESTVTATLVALVDREQAQQRAHFEAIDGKAGITLGFAGVLIALAPDVGPALQLFSSMAAVLAAACALIVLLPRRIQSVDVHRVRRAASSEPAFSSWDLVDTQVDNWRHNQTRIASKSRWLRGAFVCLFTTVALYGAGTLHVMIGALR